MPVKKNRFLPALRQLCSAAAILLLVIGTGEQAYAQAQPEMIVRDIRVEGLQRISEGTVFNYLPINVGDKVDEIRIQEAVRALYTQKLFDDIEVRRDENRLVIAVRERPSILSPTLIGR